MAWTRLYTIIGLAAAGLLLAAGAWAAGAAVGRAAPAFSVQSGTEQTLDSAQLRGKVVTLFYEAREATERGRALKDALNQDYAAQPPQVRAKVARLAVVDCSPANWITKGFWRDGLKEAGQKEGLTVYGDWDGAMRQAYGFPEDGSSFLIIGPDGTILYEAMDTARVGPEQITRIREVIAKATSQAMGR